MQGSVAERCWRRTFVISVSVARRLAFPCPSLIPCRYVIAPSADWVGPTGKRAVWKYEWSPRTCLGLQAVFACPFNPLYSHSAKRRVERNWGNQRWNASLCVANSLMMNVFIRSCLSNPQKRKKTLPFLGWGICSHFPFAPPPPFWYDIFYLGKWWKALIKLQMKRSSKAISTYFKADPILIFLYGIHTCTSQFNSVMYMYVLNIQVDVSFMLFCSILIKLLLSSIANAVCENTSLFRAESLQTHCKFCPIQLSVNVLLP